MNKVTSFLALLIMTFITIGCKANNEISPEKKAPASLINWKAGEKVTMKDVETFGIDNCFRSIAISNELFNRIYKKSFKENCTIPKEELRYLKVLHYNIEKEICLGEIICNRNISADLIEIFQALFKAQYPIEKMVLIDEYDANDEKSMRDNNSSCFNFRFISGTTRLSNHSQGYAIDINPRYNPYIRERDGKTLCSPDNAQEYRDRALKFTYKIDHKDLCFKEFKKRGFTWGGDWDNRKDYQHFEKLK